MLMPLLWSLLGVAFAAVYLAIGFRLGARERAWWSGGLIVAAGLYLGFALAQGEPGSALLFEVGGLVVYGAFAVRGLRGDLRWTAAGWLLHGLWDGFLHQPGDLAPVWYAWFCLSVDLVVGVALWHRATTQMRPAPRGGPAAKIAR
ncbi:MAG: hypothetical protein AAGJ11_11100 [Bacteroidota bacterium]